MIDSDGAQLGVMALRDALRTWTPRSSTWSRSRRREAAGLPHHGLRQVPVRARKRRRVAKKTAVELKEVKLGSQTNGHDVDFKVKNIRDFLGEGHRVKVTVFFRGRSITHPELGREMLERVVEW